MAVGDAYVFPGFLTPVLTLLFFQSHRLLFSHASAEVRGENTPERKVASTWDRTHNHQVMSPTRSPLSHPGGQILFGLRSCLIQYLYPQISNKLKGSIIILVVGLAFQPFWSLEQHQTITTSKLTDFPLLLVHNVQKAKHAL